MARYIAYDITWDVDQDSADGEHLPHAVMVCLPGYDHRWEVDPEAITDKLSDDFGFCVKGHKFRFIDESDEDFKPE